MPLRPLRRRRTPLTTDRSTLAPVSFPPASTGAVAHPLDRALTGTEAEVFEAYLASVRRLRGTVSYADLVAYLSRRDLVGAINQMDWALFETLLGETEDQIAGVMATSGLAESRRGLGHGVIAFRFDAVNPRAVLAAHSHAARLVRETSRTQREMIRDITMRGFLDGIPPKILARQIRSVVGLHSRWANAVTNYHNRLLADGVDERFAAKMADKYSDRLLDARARMIARTEVMRASNEGKAEAWRQAMDRGLLSRTGATMEWVSAPPNDMSNPHSRKKPSTCTICASLNGQRVDVNGEFTATTRRGGTFTLTSGPAHPHCRCTTILHPPEIKVVNPNDVGVRPVTTTIHL